MPEIYLQRISSMLSASTLIWPFLCHEVFMGALIVLRDVRLPSWRELAFLDLISRLDVNRSQLFVEESGYGSLHMLLLDRIMYDRETEYLILEH